MNEVAGNTFPADGRMSDTRSSRHLPGTYSQPPHSSSSMSISATTHEGITRQEGNITGTSKKRTCDAFAHIRSGFYSDNSTWFNHSLHIAHFALVDIPVWNIPFYNVREERVRRAHRPTVSQMLLVCIVNNRHTKRSCSHNALVEEGGQAMSHWVS